MRHLGFSYQDLQEINVLTPEPVFRENPKNEFKILLIGPSIHYGITDVFFGYLDGLKALGVNCEGLTTFSLKAFMSGEMISKYVHSLGMDTRKGFTHIGFVGGIWEWKWWILDSFKELGKKTFVITTEDPHQLDQNEAMYRSFDYYFTNELNVKKVFPNAFYLPTAGSTQYCQRFTQNQLDEIKVNDFLCDILHVGALYDNRKRFLKKLAPLIKKNNLKMIITGTGNSEEMVDEELREFYLPIEKISSNFTLERGMVLNHADTVLLYNCARFVLNINRDGISNPKTHSSNLKHRIVGTSLNPRCYEVPMCGSILLTDKTREEYKQVFNEFGPDQNCIAFNDETDLILQVLELIKDAKRRKNIEDNGYIFCNRNHTYKNRATRLLKFIFAAEGKNAEAAALLLKHGVGVK